MYLYVALDERDMFLFFTKNEFLYTKYDFFKVSRPHLCVEFNDALFTFTLFVIMLNVYSIVSVRRLYLLKIQRKYL